VTSTDLTALRIWADAHAPLGLVQARQVLELLGDHARLTALCQSLAERCAAQSELLSQRAESRSIYLVCNCGAGTAFGPLTGHWQHCDTNEEKQSS
jgi:hypothetical protein